MSDDLKKYSAVLAGFFFLSALPAYANPQFSHTEAGDIRIEETGAVYNIYSADKSIGAFTSFGNQAGETINSVQAAANHSVVFKVTGTDPSIFFGALNANSRVFLVNPNGILFKAGSQVNAPGLTAAAMDLKNADFVSHEFQFEAPAAGGGYVLNEGNIQVSSGGYVALIGAAVENRGSIQAPDGSVFLSAGKAATVGLDGNGSVSVKVTEAVDRPVYDLEGRKLSDGLKNSGILSAAGGQVILSVEAMDQVFDQVINHTGVIEAQSVESRNGVIVLSGGSRGTVTVSGAIYADGLQERERGGTILMTGERVGLFDTATVSATGQAGGGSVRVGGDYKGDNPDILNSTAVFFGGDSIIDASALAAGNGGRVILWSDDSTRAYGQILSLGASGGSGGFVETSSKNYLAVDGARVYAGQWLLDPFNVTITSSASSGGSFTGTNPITWTPSANGSNILNSAIATSLNAGTSVTVDTTGAAGAQAGDITVSSPIARTSGATLATLTLDATGSIFVNSSITTTAAPLDVALYADSAVTVSAAIATGGGDLDVYAFGGSTTIGTASSILTGIGDITLYASGSVLLQTDLKTQGGDVTVTPGTSSQIILQPSGSTIKIETFPATAGDGGDVFIHYPVIAGAPGVDFTIDTHGIPNGNGGDVDLLNFPMTATNFINDLTVNATGSGTGVAGTVTIDGDIRLQDNGGADPANVSITGALDMFGYGGISIPGGAGTAGSIFVSSDTDIFLGFLDADSDANNVRGDINLSSNGDMFDANGNLPNLLAGTGTFITSNAVDAVGHSFDPLETDIQTINISSVVGGAVRVFLGPFYTGPPIGTGAGVLIEGNRIIGGENFDVYTSDTSLITDPGTEPSSSGDKEEEKRGDSPATMNPTQALAPPPPIEPPASFPAEKPVQPSTFSPCANA